MPSRVAPAVAGAASRRAAPIAIVSGAALVGAVTLAVFLWATPVPGPGRAATVIKWLPYLLTGFMYNVLISLLCMLLATLVGVFVGFGQVSVHQPVRKLSVFYTQFFRNSPWLVILYSMLYLLPFEVRLGPATVQFPPWMKAVIGLTLPVSANVSEIVRGGVQSIPYGQTEAALAMGYTRRQILWLVIIPQAVRRMIPPWMNLYAILTMATSLAHLVGVFEGLTAVRRILELEGERVAVVFYALLLLLFFTYCYPIAAWTVRLERRFIQ